MPLAALFSHFPILIRAAFALRPRTVFVFSNGIPIDIKSMKALVVRVWLSPVGRAHSASAHPRARRTGFYHGSELLQGHL
jgi:hypothetical protein